MVDSRNCVVCQSAAVLICSSCSQVRYCCKEHQKVHWPTHKTQCRPYKIESNEKLGRYMVATRNLKAGDVIFREKAVVCGPKQGHTPLCLSCYAPVDDTSYRCPSCSYPFCNRQCAENAIHRDECRVLSQTTTRVKIKDYSAVHGAFDCIAPLRCLLLKKSNPRLFQQVIALQDHNENRRGTDIWQVVQINTVNFLRQMCRMADDFDDEQIHSICGILDVNAFEIKMSRNRIRGLYPLGAMMAHKCVVNTNHVIHEKDYEMVVRASVPIQKGSPIYLSYAHTLEGTKERRAHLRENKFFECDCDRCADATELGTCLSALKCQKCSLGDVLPRRPLDDASDWLCGRCSYKLSADVHTKVLAKLRQEFDAIESNDVDEYERFLKRHRSLLHPNHFLFTSARHTLSQLYGRDARYLLDTLPKKLLERKVELCKSLMAIADVVEPGQTRFRGVTLYELHAPLCLLLKQAFQSNEITADEFKEKTSQVCRMLKEAMTILLSEDSVSPEGLMGAAAQVAHQQLLQWVAAV